MNERELLERIAALEQALEQALEPFSELYGEVDFEAEDDDPIFRIGEVVVTVGELHTAAKLIRPHWYTEPQWEADER